MKLLITSDWHLDAVTAGIPRVGEFDLYLDQVVAASQEHDVDTIAVLGDYFDPGKMNGPEMTARLMEAALKLSGAGAKLLIWIAGNHDVVESSGGWTTITPLKLALEDGFARGTRHHHIVFERPKLAVFRLPGWALLALPYQARAAMIPEEMETALAAAKAERNLGVPLIVLGHMTVPGAILGSESHEMARGRDMDLPMDQLADLSPVIVANGHYHKAQTVKGPGGLRVVIPGSPHRFTFGERHDADKGFVILDIPEIPRG